MNDDPTDIVTVENLPITRDQESQLPVATAAFALVKARYELMEQMQIMAMKVLKPQDLIKYGKNPGISGPGAERIARAFGLKFFGVKAEKVNMEGGHYYIQVTGKVGFDERETIDVLGTCYSQKPFFAKKDHRMIPSSEVDLGNIQKNAMTNFMVNAVTRFLGLRGLSWKDVEILSGGKCSEAQAQTVDYQSGKADRTEDESSRAGMVWKWLLEMNGQSVKDAKAQLQDLTKFTGKDGKKFNGYDNIEKVSPKVLPRLYPRVEKLYNQWGGGESATGKTKAAPKTKAPAGNAELVKKAEELQGEITGMNPDYGDAYYDHTLSDLGFKDLGHIASDKAKMSEYLNTLLRLKSDLKAVNHSRFRGDQE